MSKQIYISSVAHLSLSSRNRIILFYMRYFSLENLGVMIHLKKAVTLMLLHVLMENIYNSNKLWKFDVS